MFRGLCNDSVNYMVRIMWEKVDVGPFFKVAVMFGWITIKLQTFVCVCLGGGLYFSPNRPNLTLSASNNTTDIPI